MSEEPSITALDDATVQRIAAGEVVERPASVVKELVENSIDADASRVSVAVERGGKDGIRVRDDGVGMSAEELDLAVRDHHTSKIGDIADLEAGVGTLGFRGEALAAVGAVSRLTMRSKPRDGEMGHELTVEGGDIGDSSPAGCPAGTVVEVDDLFYNVPARRKFLKTDATEFDHVNTVVTQYALANPGVAVSLEHDGREVFATDGNGGRSPPSSRTQSGGTGNLRSTVLSVYGREVAESMVDVEWSADDVSAETPIRSVRGLVSHPETTRAGREYLSTFVNDRYVTASTLREAVLDAYGGQLAPDRYPFAVLFVELDPATVDVNVHPRKLEVRFDDESGVKEAVSEAVKEALLAEGLIRTSAPRGRSQAGETPIQPGGDDDEVVGGADTRHEEASGVAERRTTRSTDSEKRSGIGGSSSTDEPSGGVRDSGGDGASETDLDDWSDESDGPTAGGSTTGDTPTEPTDDADDWSVDLSGGSGTSTAGGSGSSRTGGADGSDFGSEGPATSSDAPSTPEPTSRSASGDCSPESTEPTDPSPDHEQSFSTATQRSLGGGTAEAGGAFDSLPTLRVLGQLQDTYVVAETDGGLVLIDQHAADERVNYERLRRQFADGMASQSLAEPVRLELTAREAELFERHADALGEIGFDAEREGDRTVSVTAVPAVFDATLDPELLRDVLSAFVTEEDGGAPVEDAVDDLLADLACYPSVTGNTSLTEGSVSDLLSALDGCENPYACPHGRPVIVEISGEEIGDRFERDYPGHGGRRQ
ncbi:DNA mismatch repair endonuclease MutL [Halolamina salifodinae]|uniref:DNA mismatch repair protein MutL n=1 Tax=Halolamina salifodinae TaxID=1202767 RepID=A0A8T4GX67_9EURY|nr:DNA mismatch repair endonuclease MutL [Halolamina salifodinae]MBP1985888.1 DNA mismatch repair protein MutL [Halolamina salifodinae]